MLTITAQQIEDADFVADEAACSAIDYATIAHAHREEIPGFQGCELDVEWVIFMKPAEDITIPVFICTVHFNAFKYAVKTGKVGADLDVFGDIN
jgi:hypothetical protein